MARIKTYKLDDNVTGSDMWIGTDGNDASKTKNFSPTYLANYLNQNEVIDVSNSIRFTYDTIDSGKSRKSGTLSFATEIGAVVPINSITTFILSKNTQSTKLVNAFLNILPGTKIILQKSDYINIFGIFKVVSVTQITLEPDFYTVVVEYISGYGSLEEDKDYIISLIDLQGGSGDIPTKTSDLTNDGADGVNPFITLEDLPPLPPNILSALPFTTDHLAITNNQYVIGDVVYYLGNVYKCLANNDSIIPTSTLYWENVGPGFPIVQQPIDWDSTSGNNQILNKPAIPSITGLVPYTGATQNVDLGVFEITAAKLIKDGGQPEQFLKADGSVDNNVYLTSADLPSTLDLYATTTASDIPTYGVLVRNIADGRFNTVAVDVTTPVIDGIAIACGSLITDPNIISGNPGIFNFTLSGNIRKIAGPTASQAEFYFRIYKRVLAGTETLISESAKVLVPNNSGSYALFTTVALWNDGIFLDTDRIVLKFYGDLAGTGSGGTYQFQFGGISPVRGSAAIPTAVLPNIYLKDLADVENVDPLDKEILYWNDVDSLWEHSLTEDLIPNASATQKGLVSIEAQTFAGSKTFTSQPTIPANGGNLGQGAIIIDNGSGLLQVAYNAIYPNLTELSYVKGVLSPIQPQLDLKQPTLTDVNFGNFINARTAKNTLVDADEVISDDSADSNKAKKTSWLNVWTNYLKGKADLLYATVAQANATHTGDATGATALTLATVNSNVGAFTNANITVNAKGLITAATNGSNGVVGTLNVNTTAVGNVGTGEDDLITYSVPGNTLGTTNDYIDFQTSGTINGNINNKRIRVKFGSSTIFDSGVLAVPTTSDWIITGTIIRTGPTTFKASVRLNSSFSTLSASADYSTGTETLSSNLILKCTGEAVLNNDIIQELLIVKLNSFLTTPIWVDISLTSTIVGWSSFNIRDIQYLIIGNICHVRGLIGGTSNSTTTSFTMPFSYTGASSYGLLGASSVDNGVALPNGTLIRIIANTNTVLFFKDGNLNTFTATGTKQVNFSFSFKIN